MGQYVEQGYQFDLTAPQINDILLMARNFSRPNLLHNSRLAINQRGRTFPLEGVSNDNPPSGKISIGDFLVDRWHAINTGTIYTKLNPGDNNVRIKAVTHDADGVSNNVALRQLLWTPDTNENGNTNILFDKDVTISILYQDGILFTGTGHTPRWSDFQSMAYAGENKIVGSPIVVTDNNGEKHLQLICSKNAMSKNKFQVAFYLDVFGYDSEIVAAKVEIGVGQTLAIKVGSKWELIDHYDQHKDLKTCKRFYIRTEVMCANEPSSVLQDTDNWMVDTVGVFTADVTDMVFIPTYNPMFSNEQQYINARSYDGTSYTNAHVFPNGGDTFTIWRYDGHTIPHATNCCKIRCGVRKSQYTNSPFNASKYVTLSKFYGASTSHVSVMVPSTLPTIEISAEI